MMAFMIDLDLSLDAEGQPLPPLIVAAARAHAATVGWPGRPSNYRRKRRWERESALRRAWRSIPLLQRSSSSSSRETGDQASL